MNEKQPYVNRFLGQIFLIVLNDAKFARYRLKFIL